MSTDPNQRDQHDDALERILAATRSAAPPEGMEARILQCLRQHTSAPPAAAFRWRDAFATSARTGEWWRGAIAGASVVLLMTAAFALAGHLLQTYPNRMSMATKSTANRSAATAATPVTTSSYGAPTHQNSAPPCAHPTLLRTSGVIASHSTEMQRSNTYAWGATPSQAVHGETLTAQERELLRLAQSADPRLLAALNPERQARLEAENAANFAEFFAAPPQPTAPADTPAANPETSPQAGPDRVRQPLQDLVP